MTNDKHNEFPGYPYYPALEDITANIEKVADDNQVESTPPPRTELSEEDVTAEDLKMLDAVESYGTTADAENIGKEDEENNYNSLGGDNKENLKEQDTD